MAHTQRNVILLGRPGAGKGTQAELIIAEFGLPHISTGEMLRSAVDQGTEMGCEAQKRMEDGALVPDEVVIDVVRDRLTEPDVVDGFLLDGFPRTIAQAERLDEVLAEAGRAVTQVIFIDVPVEELEQRIVGRRFCSICGKLYNVIFAPPRVEGVCDVCGGELVQRADDNEETVRRRLAVYDGQTAALIDYYTERGVLQSAFGGGKLPNDVFAQVARILSEDG